MRSPAKKMERDRCTRPGNASTAQATRNCSTPFEKNARIRARLGELECAGWVILRYRRAHCCTDVASMAHVRLITKLKNQSEFTKIAYVGGEKVGWVTTDGRDTLVSA